MSQTGGRICPACRITTLSRYNSDPLCAPCTRASGESAGIVPTWLWDSPPMREALARTDIPAFVAIFRAAAGLSQMELGNLIEGWSQSLVCLTEQGKRDTLYDIRKLLDFADAVGMPRSALAPLILGQPDATLDSDNPVAFRSAITTARRELDRGLHETDPPWTKIVSHWEITAFEAMGKTELGMPARAAQLYHAVVDETTAQAPRDRASYRALLASTVVQTGDVEQAVEHGLMILPELGTTLTSGRVLQRLRPVREAAGAVAAAEFCDRFDAAARALTPA